MENSLLAKVSKRTLRIAVIGLGYVGLPLATAFAEARFHVTGIDVDQMKVGQANRGESYILHFWVKKMPLLFVCPLLWERRAIRIFPMLSQRPDK